MKDIIFLTSFLRYQGQLLFIPFVTPSVFTLASSLSNPSIQLYLPNGTTTKPSIRNSRIGILYSVLYIAPYFLYEYIYRCQASVCSFFKLQI